jgi:hypothetical protein
VPVLVCALFQSHGVASSRQTTKDDDSMVSRAALLAALASIRVLRASVQISRFSVVRMPTAGLFCPLVDPFELLLQL